MTNKKYSNLVRICAGLAMLSMVLALPAPAFADPGDNPQPTAEVVEQQDSSTSTEEAAAPTDAATVEEATATAESGDVAIEATDEPIVEENVADVAVALAETDSVLVDESGNPVSMASQAAEDAIINADPWYVDAGVTHRFFGAGGCAGQPVDAFNTCTESATPVQAAINDAPAGSTVHVEAGTFEEQVTIDKSLSLQGSAGATIQAPSVLVNNPDGTKSIIVVTGGSTSAEISGFTVTGPGPTGCGSIHYGIYVRDGAYAYIHDNTISDVRDDPFSGCQNGVAIEVGKSSAGQTGYATIENNDISGYQKNGITVDGAGSYADIVDNTITGAGPTSTIAQNGIQISRGATGRILGNTVTGNEYTPGGDTSTGILIYQVGDGVVIAGNIVEDNQTNVYLYYANNVEVTDNTISNSIDFDNLDVYYVDGATISGNYISGATMDGVWVRELG